MQGYNLPPKSVAQELLPIEFQARVNKYITFVLGEEKKEYKNDLKPFALHEQEIKNDIQEKCLALQNRLSTGQKILKTEFIKEEERNPLLSKEFSLASLQEALLKLEKKEALPTDFKTLQRELDIPWSFMDRAFQAGKVLMKENRFEEASHIFFFLRFLQPRVFEYWVCEATCLHELERLQEAISIYESSLMFQPKNPLVFFQMASCLYRLGEISAALKGFEACLQATKDDPRYAELHKEAIQIRSYLQEKR